MTSVPVDLETTIRDVLMREAEAVAAAAERLDTATFARAVELLAGCDGTVATVGAGTSGIIARKLAATLTSTGTPAVFVHPSDALHGGLGVIGRQEVVIAISNSGETEELSALLPYLESRRVPVISIVGNVDSSLARRSAVALDAHAEREAGAHGIVPTTSTAVALAIGDALALCVMDVKGVTVERFAANHPSGRLGRRLTLRVRSVMRAGEQAPEVPPGATLFDVVGAITAGGAGAVLVAEGGGPLLGIVTDGDVRRAVQRCEPLKLSELRASEMMSATPSTIGPDAMAFDALKSMEAHDPSPIAVLPVVEDGRALGLVRLHDLVQLGL